MATGEGSAGKSAASSAAAFLHGMAQLPPLPAFDFDKPGSWATSLLQYEDYSFATGPYAAPTEVHALLHGPASQGCPASTTLGEAVLKDVAAVNKDSPTPSSTHRMSCASQRAFTAVRSNRRCNYSPDVEERLTRDRFLVGSLDRKLSGQLSRNPRPMLHEALTHIRQHEDADNERKGCDSAVSSSLAVDAARLRKGKPAPADKATKQLGPFRGRASHPPADCPARRAPCNFCRKSGHFENVCLENKHVNGKHTQKPSASSIELHTVAGQRPKYVGCPLSFKVDSGAEVSMIPRIFPGVPSKLQDPKSELTSPGNNILPVIGTYVTTLSWHGKSTKQLLYVLATKTVPLLGFPAIQALGISTFVDQVSGTTQPLGVLFQLVPEDREEALERVGHVGQDSGEQTSRGEGYDEGC
ncbi:hypothetical protein HPB49_011195 [Dermacentor silvarum]|uniref:Uncharacterized protein n=1 Tax=Dermacentor silvarum TaxID=543639 RepID=A0ACB8DCJ4_DERSI|nr:hypothetical protein HPB49_011195 [Dermacentor silvarum]